MEEIYVIGHKSPDTDSIVSAIAYAYYKRTKEGIKAVPARAGEINNETRFVLEKFGVEAPQLIENAAGKKVILVDHNEKSQAVEGIEEAEIVEIIDHHRIGDIQTGNPIFFLNRPVGSTSTIIYSDFFKRSNIEMPNHIKGILLGGILSDTVILRSPITTDEDKEIVEILSTDLGINAEEFGIEMFKVKSDLSKKSAREIIEMDYKKYEFSKGKIWVSQVETVDSEELRKRKEEFLNEMKKMKEEMGLSLIVVLLTDIIKRGCLMLAIADDESIIEKAFGKKLEDNEVWLPGVMSRKKQVIPPIENLMK